MIEGEEPSDAETGDAETGGVLYGSMDIFIRGPEGGPVLLGTFRADFLSLQQFTQEYKKFLCEGKPLGGRLFCLHGDGSRRYLVIAFKDVWYLY